jgi:hypothetical protein
MTTPASTRSEHSRPDPAFLIFALKDGTRVQIRIHQDDIYQFENIAELLKDKAAVDIHAWMRSANIYPVARKAIEHIILYLTETFQPFNAFWFNWLPYSMREDIRTRLEGIIMQSIVENGGKLK